MEIGFHVPELRACSCGVNARDDAFPPGVRVVGRQGEPIPQRYVHADVAHVRKAAVPAAGPAGVAESPRLKGAPASIPEIRRVRQPQRVKLVPQHEPARQPKGRARIEILVIHHVVERKPRVRARRRQHLKKCPVRSVSGIGIAAAVGIAEPKPRIQNPRLRLPARLRNKRARTLGERAPASVLQRAPHQKINLAVTRRIENVNIVSAVRPNANMPVVRGARRSRAVIRLQNFAAFIHITQSKKPQLACRTPVPDRSRVCSVKQINVEFTHRVNLKNTSRRPRAEQREIARSGAHRKLRSVVAPLHRGKAEIPDESLRNPSVHQRCKRFVLWRHFRAVQKCEAPEPQLAVFWQGKIQIGLAYEPVRVVRAAAIRREIRSAQPELPRSSRQNRAGRQPQDGVLRALDEPPKMFQLLAESDSQQGMVEGVRILPGNGRLKPIPRLRSPSPVHREVKRAQLVRFRCFWILRLVRSRLPPGILAASRIAAPSCHRRQAIQTCRKAFDRLLLRASARCEQKECCKAQNGNAAIFILEDTRQAPAALRVQSLAEVSRRQIPGQTQFLDAPETNHCIVSLHRACLLRDGPRYFPALLVFAFSRGSLAASVSVPPSALTTGAATKCSARNHTCSSLWRITSLMMRSFVPSSPASAACSAIVRASFKTISWASSSLEICTGTSSRPRGGRGIIVVSATSCAIARLTPPSS